MGVLLLAAACAPQTVAPLDDNAALNPENCGSCHPDQYQAWRGSMHAYSSYDPVFTALNLAGQRATDGALGDFCVQCHAPMALAEGAATDGLDLASVPDHLRGVSCAACHAVDEVSGLQNNGLVLGDYGIQRGGLVDPEPTQAHEHRYSTLHDRNELASADLCGSCHDVVTPAGIFLERTYAEWQSTQYASDEGSLKQTCGQCHMDGYDAPAAISDGAPLRRSHDHTFPAVGVPLIDFPGSDRLADMVVDRLDPTVLASVVACGSELGVEIRLRLENVAAGHSWPSGAAQHRRGWVQLQAYQGDTLIFSTGVIADDEALFARDDPNLWWFGDRLYDIDGNEVHGAWAAETIVSSALPGLDADGDNHVARTWYLGDTVPTRVEAVVMMRGLDRDLLEWLVVEGDLDPAMVDAVPTWTLAQSAVSWWDMLGPCPA